MTESTAPWTYAILISGQLGSGKTTLQQALFTDLSARLPTDIVVKMYNFADELKRECAERAGVPAATFYTEEGKKQFFSALGMTGRELLQSVGEEARQRDALHWVDRVRCGIARAAAERGVRGVLAVVGDCRHPNEVEFMRPGLAVRLMGDPGGVRARSSADLTHVSETAMNAYQGFDALINTDLVQPDKAVEIVLRRLHSVEPTLFHMLAPPAPAIAE